MSTSFRDKMKKQKKTLKKRHNAPQRQSTGRYPTFFIKDNIPEGISFFTSKEGEHIIDIVPFKAGPDMPLREDDDKPVTKEGNLDYLLDLEVHMNVGAMKKPFICPYQNFGLPCPICEYMKETKLEKEEWSAIKTKRRVVYLVWVHDSIKDEKKGLQLFHASHFLMEEKLAEIAKIPKQGGSIEFSDYDEGMSIVWTHKGKGRDTRYIGHKLIPREVPIPDKILNKSFSLDDIVNMHPTYLEIKTEFYGAPEEDDEPVKKKKKKKKKKKSSKTSSSKSEKIKKKKKKKKKKKTDNFDDDIPF